MLDFVVLMPTFNRSGMVEGIMRKLRGEALINKLQVVHIIVDDGSDWRIHKYQQLIATVARPLKGYAIQYVRNQKKYGRRGFWRTWTVLMREAKKLEWEYAISIPDDHMPCDKFFCRIEELFLKKKAIEKNIVAMNILTRSKRNWHTRRFVDGAFICTREFFSALGWKMNAVSDTWFQDPKSWPNKSANPIGSGVGKQMTDRLAKDKNYRIAVAPRIAFLDQMQCESVMFPKAYFPYRPDRWGLRNFVDKGTKK